MDARAADRPTISVVIPTFNQGHFLEQSLVSIIDQDHVGTELIVIDGGSDDDTVEILRRFDRHISFWVSESDRGQSDALNKGFAVASGDILCWQNSDDYYLEGAFAAVIETFRGNPDASVVYGDWLEIAKDGSPLMQRYALDFSSREIRHKSYSIFAQTMFWRRKVHDRFGKFPVEFHQVMDNYMILRFALNEGPDAFVRVNRTLGVFRQHEDQKTGHLESVIVRREIEEMDERLGLTRKRGLVGFAVRLSLRMKRVVGYWRRGGFPYVIRFFTKSIKERG